MIPAAECVVPTPSGRRQAPSSWWRQYSPIWTMICSLTFRRRNKLSVLLFQPVIGNNLSNIAVIYENLSWYVHVEIFRLRVCWFMYTYYWPDNGNLWPAPLPQDSYAALQDKRILRWTVNTGQPKSLGKWPKFSAPALASAVCLDNLFFLQILNVSGQCFGSGSA